MDSIDFQLRLHFSKRKWAYIHPTTKLDTGIAFYGNMKGGNKFFGLIFDRNKNVFNFICKGEINILTQTQVARLNGSLIAAMQLVAKDGMRRETPTF